VDITNRDVVGFIEQYIAAEQAQLTSDQLLNIQNGINSIITSVNGLTAGQDALDNNLGAFESTVLDLLGRILSRANATQPEFTPVTLPLFPPIGYGPGTSISAADVWSFPSAITGNDANDRLDDIDGLAKNLSSLLGSVESGTNPPWRQQGTWQNPGLGPTDASGMAPVVDFRTILATDATAVDWINREYPGFGVAADLGDGRPYYIEGSTGFITFLDISSYQFDQIKAGVSPLGGNVPPIWPGLALVTLGTPVALVDGLTLAIPLDGVLVEGITAPAGKKFVTYGAVQSWRHIASLAFVTDNGDVEQFQAVNFGSQLFATLGQKRAAGVVFHVSGGVTGTVIPWTVT
jgi:hypothetical protein